MAVYLDTRAAAEAVMRDGYNNYGDLPVFFGKILLWGEEKWILDFETRDYRFATFRVIENHSHRICQLLANDEAENR